MSDTLVKPEYDSLELMVMGQDKTLVPYTINKSNINYHRAYVSDGSLKTSIYFIGNPKALIIECGYDQLNMKLDRNSLIHRMLKDLNGDEIKLVKKFVEELKSISNSNPLLTP